MTQPNPQTTLHSVKFDENGIPELIFTDKGIYRVEVVQKAMTVDQLPEEYIRELV